MLLVSWERSTGRGAYHATEVLATDGEWYPLSAYDCAVHQGREDGWEIWQGEFSAESEFRAVHRTNSGHLRIEPSGQSRGIGGPPSPPVKGGEPCS